MTIKIEKYYNSEVVYESEKETIREAVIEAVDRGANLGGANLGDQWIIQGPVRSDGYFFFLQKQPDNDAPMVKAGCRHFTLPEARAHWEATRKGTPLGDETFAILDCLEALAKARGYL